MWELAIYCNWNVFNMDGASWKFCVASKIYFFTFHLCFFICVRSRSIEKQQGNHILLSGNIYNSSQLQIFALLLSFFIIESIVCSGLLIGSLSDHVSWVWPNKKTLMKAVKVDPNICYRYHFFFFSCRDLSPAKVLHVKNNLSHSFS